MGGIFIKKIDKYIDDCILELKVTSEYLSFNKTVREIYQLIYEAYLKALIENKNGAFRTLKDEDLIYVVPVGFQKPAKIYVKNINKKRAIL